MRIRVSSEQIWTARVHPPRSTAEASFRSPLVVLPLAVRGGGGPESNAQLLNGQDLFALINGAFRRIPDPPCHSAFNGGGGGSGMVWRVKWDPSPVTSPTVSCFPLATYTPLNRATGPVPIGHSLTLLGFVPIGQSLALSGFGGCRVERFDISVAPSHELLRGAMVI
jgi:hypothetical protein